MRKVEADSLAKLASVPSSKLSKTILIEYLEAPSIQDKELLIVPAELNRGWRASIIWYLQDKEEPTFQAEARKLRYKTFHYMLIDDVLYKWGHLLPFLQCLDSKEAEYMLREIHKGAYVNHSACRSLSHKVLR